MLSVPFADTIQRNNGICSCSCTGQLLVCWEIDDFNVDCESDDFVGVSKKVGFAYYPFLPDWFPLWTSQKEVYYCFVLFLAVWAYSCALSSKATMAYLTFRCLLFSSHELFFGMALTEGSSRFFFLNSHFSTKLLTRPSTDGSVVARGIQVCWSLAWLGFAMFSRIAWHKRAFRDCSVMLLITTLESLVHAGFSCILFQFRSVLCAILYKQLVCCWSMIRFLVFTSSELISHTNFHNFFQSFKNFCHFLSFSALGAKEPPLGLDNWFLHSF